MDNRKMLSGASATPPTAPASPSSGHPTAGNPGTNTPPSNLGDFWFYQIGEELRAIIVDGGLTPSTGTLNQVLLALKTLFGTVLTNAGQPYGVKIGTLLIQWGKVATSNTSVTLLTAFADANYTLVVGNIDTQGAYSDVAYGTVTDASHIFVGTKASTTGAASNFGVAWVAFGKA